MSTEVAGSKLATVMVSCLKCPISLIIIFDMYDLRRFWPLTRSAAIAGPLPELTQHASPGMCTSLSSLLSQNPKPYTSLKTLNPETRKTLKPPKTLKTAKRTLKTLNPLFLLLVLQILILILVLMLVLLLLMLMPVFILASMLSQRSPEA